MSERMASAILEHDKKTPIEEVRKVGTLALAIVEMKYCSGYPNFSGGNVPLANHNAHHGYKVGDDTERLGVEMGFDPFDLALGRTTGNAHDINQQDGRGIDEQKSADWVATQLRRRRVISAEAIKRSAGAIIGTEPLFDDEGLICDQKVNHMEFDSLRDEVFAKAVASADMGELYTPLGPLVGHKLYAEIQGADATTPPPLDNLLEFQRKQVILHGRYEYPLGKTAEEVFASHKPQVIRYIEHVYTQLLRGNIETWEQLLAQDEAFSRNPEMKLA